MMKFVSDLRQAGGFLQVLSWLGTETSRKRGREHNSMGTYLQNLRFSTKFVFFSLPGNFV
jgi:hypothetical protein